MPTRRDLLKAALAAPLTLLPLLRQGDKQPTLVAEPRGEDKKIPLPKDPAMEQLLGEWELWGPCIRNY